MYTPADVLPVIRSNQEKSDPHPVFRAFMQMRYSVNFAKEGAREKVIPTYMGLIRQIDDQLGILFAFLEQRGLAQTTMVVFTSDHGDYLGDHWMGEKDLFHDPSVKIPLIIANPFPEADGARGSVCDKLIEAIDLAPTFIEYFGGVPETHILEGRSLTPLITGMKSENWRRCVFSEYDYSMQEVRLILNQSVADSRLYMVFDGRWKYVHAPGFRPMLFDLVTDPHELADLGADENFEDERTRLRSQLLSWALADNNRITMSDAKILTYAGAQQLKSGILIGYWDEAELAAARAHLGLS